MDIQSRLKISTRIYAGFGTILALLLLIASIAYSMGDTSASQFHAYANIATNAVHIGKINTKVSDMRRNVLWYLTDSKEESLDRVRGILNQIKNLLPKAIAQTHDMHRLDVLKEMESMLNAYISGIETIPALHKKRATAQTEEERQAIIRETDALVAKLSKLGADFGQHAEDLSTSQQDAMTAIEEGALEKINTAQNEGTMISFVSILFGLCVAWLISRSIVTPIRAMTEAMTQLAEGHNETEIPATDRGDEIGQMAKAVLIFKDNAIENEALQRTNAEQKKRSEQKQKEALNAMADSFQEQVGGVIDAVTSATFQLHASAKQMASNAASTSSQATSVAAAAEESSSNVQAVASATEELSSSISEILQQVERSRRVATQADQETSKTSDLFNKLKDDVNSISEIVSLINDIASQTNLLALNATIEAARAGNAGKGFAVVASEVKNLATQTSKATEEVSSKINAIQTGTLQAVSAVESIAKVISEMNSISGSVAAAVNQQGAATSEISRNVEQASMGTHDVSRNIGSVETAARETGTAAEQIASSSNDLSTQSESLSRAVASFLSMVRGDKAEVQASA